MDGLDKKGISDDSDGYEGMSLADDKQGDDGEIKALVDSDTDLIKMYNEANRKRCMRLRLNFCVSFEDFKQFQLSLYYFRYVSSTLLPRIKAPPPISTCAYIRVISTDDIYRSVTKSLLLFIILKH